MTALKYVVMFHFKKSFVSLLPHYAICGPYMYCFRRPQAPRWLGGHLLWCALQSETAFIGGAEHKRQKHTFLLLRPNFLGQIYLPHIQE